MKRLFCALVIGVFVVPLNAQETTFKGVTFPRQATIANTTCTFNGVGLRKKLIISVYVGGLYLERPTRNANTVIESDQVKQVILHILYSKISGEQLVEAWNEGFEKNAPDAVTTLKSSIDTFNGWFAKPVKKGERIVVTYVPDTGTTVSIAGEECGTIPGAPFMRALFSIWFGPHPPSDDLKQGMLGD